LVRNDAVFIAAHSKLCLVDRRLDVRCYTIWLTCCVYDRFIICCKIVSVFLIEDSKMRTGPKILKQDYLTVTKLNKYRKIQIVKLSNGFLGSV
jgi:hypothetical protein